MSSLKPFAALTYTLCTCITTLLLLPPPAAATATASPPASFDFIIIGGGTAGLAIANRLSELPNITIGIIEPGHDERNNPNVTSVEGFGGTNGLNTHIDWVYETTEQRFAGNRQLEYHSGRAWGGTSTINGMTYIRPEKAQLNAWETLGNGGWTWDTLWPYHLKGEQFLPPTRAQVAAGASYIDAYHGCSGPVSVGYQYGLQNGSFATTVNETWRAFGVPLNLDVNGGHLRGFFVWPQTLDREANVRDDAARAYYAPVMGRGNLVMVEGRVDRILWADGKEGVDGKALARGVEYTASDGKGTLYADREVIVATGSVRSPAVLELSGVGNPGILEGLDIPVKVALPSVGENALDQPNSFMAYSSNASFTGTVPYVTYMTASDILGAETQTIADEVASQLRTWAEQAAAESRNAVSASAIEHLYKIQHELIFAQDVPCVEILTTGIGTNVGSAFFILLPFSRGSVHIASADPAAYPSINPNYFSVDWDLMLQRKIAQVVSRFWGTDPVRALVGSRLQPPLEDVPGNATDGEWEGWVSGSFTPNHHLLSTAAMLPRELGGVVDANLVVYGTENVRVVDASVIPAQVSGHLTSIIYAVAERAADLIKRGL
ncbi:hypothetical protein BDW62DRAFT_219745 [Aspergillus aurantiobrunneus]